ncbi:MAG: soluble cytochrome b562 [Phycisphaerales bacterium]|jgi:soluble cytochrome b562
MPKARSITVAVLALSAVASLGFIAQPDRSRRPGSPIIHRKMEAMEEAWDALTESLGAGETAAALKSLQKMQEAVIDAKARTPAITKEYEPEERDAQNADFRKRLVGVLGLYCDLELLIIDGDTEGALELLEGEIRTAEREGHNIFKPKRGG